jgi:hypothetical protein
MTLTSSYIHIPLASHTLHSLISILPWFTCSSTYLLR